jgi:hypothetical protein
LRFTFREVARAIWDATDGREAIVIMKRRKMLELGDGAAFAMQELAHSAKSAMQAMWLLKMTNERAKGVKVIEESEKLVNTNY